MRADADFFCLPVDEEQAERNGVKLLAAEVFLITHYLLVDYLLSLSFLL